MDTTEGIRVLKSKSSWILNIA